MQMNLQRFIYLDAPGLASLYAQLHGQDVVETLLRMEHNHASGWKMAIGAFLGLGGGSESSRSMTEGRTTKVVLRSENMLREIVASLRANGTLHDSIPAAIAFNASGAAWFETRHSFSVPPRMDEFNRMRAIVFVSGFPPYFEPSPETPRISMSASLHHFPTARDGQLSISGHDALFFHALNGRPHSYSVFGSVFSCGDGYQVKPYAIHL